MYYEAYIVLTTCRTEAGCIPWTALAQYAQMHDYTTDQLDDLVHYSGELDTEFLSWNDTKQAGKPSLKMGKNGNPQRVR